MDRIEIGVFKNFKECACSPCNGNHFSSIYIVRAIRANFVLITRKEGGA